MLKLPIKIKLYSKHLSVGDFLRLFTLFLSLLVTFTAFSDEISEANDLLESMLSDDPELKTTEDATHRISAWRKVIKDNQSKPVNVILENVNNFFNGFGSIPDTPLEGSADHWKTPYEFLQVGAGDCEDFAISKYFTLVALHVSDEHLRITYVTVKPKNEAHMVLAYYPTPDSEPLILDNLIHKILPASQRPDLVPVYSFNAEEVWLVERMDKSKPYAKSSSLSKWKALQERIKSEGEIK